MPIVIAKRQKVFDQGELIRVPVPGTRGRSIKLTRAEAKARGLLPRTADSPKTKEKKGLGRNKARRPAKESSEAEQ